MGSYASKLLARYGDEVTEIKTKSPRSEDLGPLTPADVKRTLPMDPRSASVGIPRTPIEVNYTPPNASRRLVTAIPTYLQKKPYLETDLDNIAYLAPRKVTPPGVLGVGDVLASPISHHQLLKTRKIDVPTIDVTDQSPLALSEHEAGDTPITELRYKILGIDPRSPAADFDRTPILTPKSLIRLKARSQENLVRRDSCFELGITDQQRLSFCETTTLGNIPEVLALPDIMSDLVGINSLNTIENSDQFESCSSSSGASIETISDRGEEITVIRNPNVKSTRDAVVPDTMASFGSSDEKIQDSQDISCLVDNVNRVLSIATKAADKQHSLSEIERKITVWRDSISPEITETPDVDESEDSPPVQSNVITLPKEEVMIEFDDTEIIKPPKMQTFNKQEVTDEIKAKKQELIDRKNKNSETDGKIFFQEKIFNSDAKNINRTPKIRTPLGNRSNNHGKVNSMPMKSPQQLLRGKAMSTKLHQENTPPRSIKSKLNGTQWDPDSTVLI